MRERERDGKEARTSATPTIETARTRLLHNFATPPAQYKADVEHEDAGHGEGRESVRERGRYTVVLKYRYAHIYRYDACMCVYSITCSDITTVDQILPHLRKNVRSTAERIIATSNATNITKEDNRGLSMGAETLAVVSHLPPTIKVRVPASAPPTPPETGASTKTPCGGQKRTQARLIVVNAAALLFGEEFRPVPLSLWLQFHGTRSGQSCSSQ